MNLEIIKNWLIETNIPKTYIAKNSGVTRKTLYNIIDGKNIREKSLRKIKRVYDNEGLKSDVPLDYLFHDGVYRLLEDYNFVLQNPSNESCDKQNIFLTTVNFEPKSWELNTNSRFELNRLASYLKQNEEYFMFIAGHTDSDSTLSYNLQLSKNRAESVKQYLVRNGCKTENLVTKGLGESKPVESNATELGKYKNRRVEFCVILSSPESVSKLD